MSINNLHIYAILYSMLVSNSNNLLNILLPNDNKVLKEALKNADTQTLANIKKDSSTVGEILKNLFDDLKTGDKNKNNIENILKNSTLFKDLGNFSKSLTTLLNQIEADPNLEKFKPVLQNFLKDISNLDEKALKDLIGKSGVFLESKALAQTNATTNLPRDLETILNQIKEVVKNIPTLEAKKIENLIDKLLQNNVKTGNPANPNALQTQNNNDLKALITNLQNLSQGLSDKQLSTLTNLINSLKNISNQAQVVESKFNNIPTNQGQTSQNLQNLASTTVDTLTSLKNEILSNQNFPNQQNVVKQLDNIIQSKELFTKPETLGQAKNLLSQLTNLAEIKIAAAQNSNIAQLVNNINTQNSALTSFISNPTQNIAQQTQVNNLSPELLQVKQNILSQTTQTLNQLKSELLVNGKVVPDSQAIIKQIDTLLQSNDLFLKNSSLIEPKNLLSQLTNLNEVKIAANQNTHISVLVDNLKTQTESITSLENRLLQNQNIQSDKQQLTQNIQQTLGSLRSELAMIKGIDTSVVNQIIDKLLNLQNLFSKVDIPLDMKSLQQNLLNQNNPLNNFPNNFSSNLNSLILTLKENIVNLSSNQTNLNLQQTVLNGVEKLETIVTNLIQNQNVAVDKQLAQNPLQNDMKTVLLQMQNELATKTDPVSMETFKQVEKLVMQIEYHQLLSIASNSNNVYVPFLWDMLDDGSIAIKKLNEDKFYCEINLSLKELGQIQLLLSLYDKNKLDLTVYASKDGLKESIRENMAKLKQALNSANLIPVNINIIDMKKNEDSKEVKQTNAFNQNSNLGFGVDIRV